jgi:leucyl/phenylalanyl-tRNA---protein transferase
LKKNNTSYQELFESVIFNDKDYDEEPSLITTELNPAIVLTGYKNGFFPWFQENGLFFWFCPNPRCVMFPTYLHISKSMKKVINQNKFEFRWNTACEEVMMHCANIKRKPVVYLGEVFANDSTWLDDDFKKTYLQLHQMGFTCSAEAWQNDKLVGGMYGLLIGGVFYGESMFAIEDNASKFAFIKGVEYMVSIGVQLMDCQQRSSHVMSLGANTITRNQFVDAVKILTN